jgi:DNA-binding NtrC family response regulator
MVKNKLLLLEDEVTILESYGQILVNNGYEVFLAKTYDEAIRLIEEYDFDVVILDIFLKERRENGLDVALFAKERHNSTQAVIFTGRPDTETMARATQLEVYEYLIKPVEPDTLLKSISKAIDMRNLINEKEELRNKLENIIDIQKHRLENGDLKFTQMIEKMIETDKLIEERMLEYKQDLAATIRNLESSK